MDFAQLDLSQTKDVIEVVQRIVPVDTMSNRLKMSMAEVGKKVVSWPQLAGDVFLGSAGIAYLTRSILTGKTIESGRYFIDFESLFTGTEKHV